jgi:GMP synthase (glutamine-hydrolysing)
MTHILILEGNQRTHQKDAMAAGLRTCSQIYSEAIFAHFPTIRIDVLHGAEAQQTPPRPLSDYDGLVISGSTLHAYEDSFEVQNQTRWINAFAETGAPILGSCWGLQIAVVAAGGQVAASSKGREIGFARDITLTDEGLGHPFLAGRSESFDAPCIHFDEVTKLPPKARVLASNAHSPVQAAAFPISASEVWAVQYHPEFDLAHMGALLMRNAKTDVQKDYSTTLNQFTQTPDDKLLADKLQLGLK